MRRGSTNPKPKPEPEPEPKPKPKPKPNPRVRDKGGLCAREALDRRTHSGLELQHLVRGGVRARARHSESS